jgi:hypothetical protein
METKELKIVSARITAMPKSFFDPMPEVWVKLEGKDEEEKLFDFYPDEINFNTYEFVGLTISQARTLKYQKDIAYLRS